MAVVTISGQQVILAEPVDVKKFATANFIGREDVLRLCRTAWNYAEDSDSLLNEKMRPLNFRLEGPPGVGKNEIIYQIVNSLKRPLYIMQGHEELTPEDVALLLVPNSSNGYGSSLSLRASPLATAIYTGGICLFDEINRVPYRSLSPLSSALDTRLSLYSAMAGIHIEPRDDKARENFRFCCTLNPSLSEAGAGVLPEYIEQRTLPAIQIGYPKIEDLIKIIGGSVNLDDGAIAAFENWYYRNGKKEISSRQAITLMQYTMLLSSSHNITPADALQQAQSRVFASNEEEEEITSDEADEINPDLSDDDF